MRRDLKDLSRALVTSSPAPPPTAPTSTRLGAAGIQPEPAAAIVRRRGGQTGRAPGRGRLWRAQMVLKRV